MEARIAVLPGDGVGPEIMPEALKVLDAVEKKYGHKFERSFHLIGGAAIDATGTPLPPETLAACQSSDAVLFVAAGGSKWSDPLAPVRPEQGLMDLRKGLDLFANLRPVKAYKELVNASPLRPERLVGVDMIVVRELTGGLYFGPRKEGGPGDEYAYDTMAYTGDEIRRVSRVAFELARGRRKKLTLVDKANVLSSSRLWRRVVTDLSKEYPDVTMDVLLVDSAAMQLLRRPSDFDVMVTENTFGDILTDEASMLSGSMGMLPSASLGAGRMGLYEPIHGTAPDIAGKGIANPIGTILSIALMLRYSFSLETEARGVEAAVERVLEQGHRTADIANKGEPTVSTRQMAELIAQQI